MVVIVNGVLVYGMYKIFVVIFLMFMEYVRNVICMFVLMKLLNIFVFIYDLIGFGEDGFIY